MNRPMKSKVLGLFIASVVAAIGVVTDTHILIFLGGAMVGEVLGWRNEQG